jgi:hypothetical protein
LSLVVCPHYAVTPIFRRDFFLETFLKK